MNQRASLTLGLAVSLLAVAPFVTPALGHAPIKGIGTFYNGVLHPVLVPAHLLLIVGLGLLLGQHASRSRHWGWFAFIAALWVGLLVGQALAVTVPQAILLALALIVGGCVALELSLGAWPLAVVMAAAGAGIGFDSRPDTVPQWESWVALFGVAVGGVLLLSYVGGLAVCLGRPWQRIGIRVVGSWTAASAGIVLALALVGQDAAPPG